MRHVEVIARVLGGKPAGRLSPEQWAGAEAQLAAKAEVYTPSELQQWGAALVELLDQDGAEPDDRPEIPDGGRPFRRGVKADLMPSLHQTSRQPLQIRFRAAAGRKAAPDESYGKLVGSHLRDMETLLGSNRHNTC